MKFDVEFTLSRLPLRLQHRAVDLASKHQLEEVLFPSGAAADSVPLPELRSGGYESAPNTHSLHSLCDAQNSLVLLKIRKKKKSLFRVVYSGNTVHNV